MFLFDAAKFSFIIEGNLLTKGKIIERRVVIKDSVCFKIMMRIILLAELFCFIIKMDVEIYKVYCELLFFYLS
jgi:hypothetical protein